MSAARLLTRVDEIERDVFSRLAQREGYIALNEVLAIIKKLLDELDAAIRSSGLSPQEQSKLRKSIAQRLNAMQSLWALLHQ